MTRYPIDKSNERHLGTIRSTSPTADKARHDVSKDNARCCSGSLILPTFINDQSFDLSALFKATKVLARNLDNIVDQLCYDSPTTKLRSMESRVICVGIQGLADAMTCLGMSMESEGAAILNRAIAETVYYASLETSCEIAEESGRCPAWEGSPSAREQLQYRLWHVTPSRRYDWPLLQANIRRYGLRNMLSVSLYSVPDVYNVPGVSIGIDPITK